MNPAAASLAFHLAANADAAVHVLCAVLNGLLTGLPVGAFHLAWARGDYDKLDGAVALDTLQADGWVTIEGEHIGTPTKAFRSDRSQDGHRSTAARTGTKAGSGQTA